MGFEQLPPEITSHILGYIDPRQKSSVRLVSKEFNMLSTEFAHKRDDQFGNLAWEVAETSSAGERYGSANFHPDRAKIAKLVGASVQDKSRFNDLLIMAFIAFNDLPRQQFAAWLDQHPILRSGPSNVNPVQVAECLSWYFAPQEDDGD